MVSVERYERIRKMLKKKVLAIADKHKIRFGGMNSFTDITGSLLGPSLHSLGLGQEYLDKYRSVHIASLWAVRKYLSLIDNHPEYREGEARAFPENGFDCAFPDIQKETRYQKYGAKHYVWRSVDRISRSKKH